MQIQRREQHRLDVPALRVSVHAVGRQALRQQPPQETLTLQRREVPRQRTGSDPFHQIGVHVDDIVGQQ